jgi:Uma2 family endonuclease
LITGHERRDETIKLKCERAGVAEYWFVDPGHDLVVKTPFDQFRSPIELRVARRIDSTELLPGLALSVSNLFRDE